MDTSIIIAASAVGGSAIGVIALVHRHYSDTLRRLRNSNACRDRKLEEAARLEKQLRGWLDERDNKIARLERECNASMSEIANLRRDLERAGKPDQPRDPVTGRWLAKPIKSGDYTINKPDAKPTPDDGWIKWTGGECPVPEDSCIEVKLRTGGTHGQLGPRDWIWSHDPADPAWDIIAYRIVSAEQREAA